LLADGFAEPGQGRDAANATGAAKWQTVKSALFVSISSRL
jgi:hypothetical protein